MPRFYKVGEAYKIHKRAADPNGQYANRLPGQLQKKLESLPPPQKVTTLAEMSPEKQAEMRRLYGRKA